MSQTTITDIGAVGIPVSDQDKAVEFFVGTLGFEKRLDMRMGESFRWVTVAAPSASTSVALIAGPHTGADTGIRFLVPMRKPSTPPCGNEASRSGTCFGGRVCRPCSSSRIRTGTGSISSRASPERSRARIGQCPDCRVAGGQAGRSRYAFVVAVAA